MAKIKPKKNISDAFDLKTTSDSKRSRPWRQKSQNQGTEPAAAEVLQNSEPVPSADETPQVMPVKEEVVITQPDLGKAESAGVEPQGNETSEPLTASEPEVESIKQIIKKEKKKSGNYFGSCLKVFKKIPGALSGVSASTGKLMNSGAKSIFNASDKMLHLGLDAAKGGAAGLSSFTKSACRQTAGLIVKSGKILPKTETISHAGESVLKTGKGVLRVLKDKITPSGMGGEKAVAASKAGLKEIKIGSSGPQNILVKISMPRDEKTASLTKDELLDQLSERIAQILPEEDNDNIIILNLDDYFSRVKEG